MKEEFVQDIANESRILDGDKEKSMKIFSDYWKFLIQSKTTTFLRKNN
jgi:hypothetical protein